MIVIEKNAVVAMRYIMRNSKGDVLENTMNAQPVHYLHGTTSIQPALQAQLEGLQAGDKKMVYLIQESGLTEDDFSFEVTIDSVRTALPEEIVLGYPVKMDMDACEIDCACYS